MVILGICLSAQAEPLTEAQLGEIGRTAFERRKEARGDAARIQTMRDALGDLNDVEKTQVLAFYIFSRDAKDGRMRAGYGAPAGDVLMDDPSLITDPSELKRMLGAENDVRKFHLLSSMSEQIADAHKVDFIPEYSRMLFRHEPMAKMGGEYIFENLTNASFFAYDGIVNNLKTLGAGFPPPDQELPYEERIPILVKWLKANWPGCDNLGMPESKNKDAAVLKTQNPRPVIRSLGEKQSTIESPESGISTWPVITIAICLFMAAGTWIIVNLSRRRE